MGDGVKGKEKELTNSFYQSKYHETTASSCLWAYHFPYPTYQVEYQTNTKKKSRVYIAPCGKT